MSKNFTGRGREKDNQGDYTGAIADFTQATRLDPNNAQAYVGRGDYYNLLGKFPEAIADYNEAIRLNPNYGDAYFNPAFRKK